jgi:hypothetical protein
MGLHDPFGYLKHKLWPKEGSKVKLPIWSLTTKIQEWPWFAYLQVACHILLESSRQGLQFFFRLHINQMSSNEIMGLQSCGSPNFENFRIPNLRILGKIDIWVHAPWLGTENTIRGKVVVSPKFGPWWILWIHVCLWLIRAWKVFQLCTSQLVVWLCRSVWIIDSLITHPSPHPGVLTCPAPLPPKCYELRSIP